MGECFRCLPNSSFGSSRRRVRHTERAPLGQECLPSLCKALGLFTALQKANLLESARMMEYFTFICFPRHLLNWTESIAFIQWNWNFPLVRQWLVDSQDLLMSTHGAAEAGIGHISGVPAHSTPACLMCVLQTLWLGDKIRQSSKKC